MGIGPVKTQVLAIALRKSVLPYSCFPSLNENKYINKSNGNKRIDYLNRNKYVRSDENTPEENHINERQCFNMVSFHLFLKMKIKINKIYVFIKQI
jgi:hypothetical protein